VGWVVRGRGIEARGFRGGGWVGVGGGLGRVGAGAGLGRGMRLGGEAFIVREEAVVEGGFEVRRLVEVKVLLSCSVRKKLERVLCPLRRLCGSEAWVLCLLWEAVVPALVGFGSLRARSASMA